MTRLTRSFRFALISLVLAGVGAACSVKDPLFCDATHPCADLALDYCDLTGAYAPDHIGQTCIASPFDAAPLCTPGAFDRCDGDTLYRCDATGYAYEPVACELGCSATAGACRLCTPSTTACTNGTVATCDANGDVVSSKACPLGCFQAEPRCTDVDPSNGLAPYLDLTTTVGVDLDLTDGATIDTSTGAIKNGDGSNVVVTSQLIQAPANGVPVRVFIVKSAHLRDLGFIGPNSDAATPAFALVSDGPILLDGTIDATDRYSRVPPGSFVTGPCTGSAGGVVEEPNNRVYVAGSSGAGHATRGGKGGGIEFLAGEAPPLGGLASGTATLTPLRGGCVGGGLGTPGGGAIQLTSRTRIELAAGSVINANGTGGGGNQYVQAGGGSGGGILIEAPDVSLAAQGALVANGGGGCSGGAYGSNGLVSTMQAPGGTCPGNQATICGAGGAGGAAAGLAGDGGWLSYTNASNVMQLAGAGGGAVGYIRINTGAGTYTKASDAIESPTPSSGTLKTR